MREGLDCDFGLQGGCLDAAVRIARRVNQERIVIHTSRIKVAMPSPFDRSFRYDTLGQETLIVM